MVDGATLDRFLWRVLLVVAVLYLLYRNIGFVALLLLAVIVATAIMPVADAAERRRVPRAVTVLAVYVVGVGLIVFLAALLVPVIADQGARMIARWPAARQQVLEWVAKIKPVAGRWEWIESIALPEIRLEQLAPFAQDLMQRSIWVTRGLFSGTAALIMLLFLSGYFVVDRRRIAAGLLTFVSPDRREEVSRVTAVVLQRMGGYVRGQAMVSATIAALLSIGLALLRFEAPLVVGITAGFLNMVPYLGSVVALLLALLIAANQSLLMVVGVLVVFVVVQAVEGSVLSPYFLGREVDLHPLVVFAALIVGANLGGLMGVVLSVPLAAGLNALVRQVYVEPLQAGRA